MRTYSQVEHLLDTAERERRCAFGENDSMRRALLRRAHIGELVNPYRNIYARSAYWSTLSFPERSLHVAQALNRKHRTWVFAGLIAATAHGLEHAWSLHNGRITVAVTGSVKDRTRQPLDRIHMPRVDCERIGGLSVTPAARTLVDCGLKYSFANALAMFDSALRQGKATHDDVLEVCDGMSIDCGPVLRLLHHADARSENGGESLARGIIIDNGFATPELQVEVADPANPRNRYRADFVWRLHDGRVIVAEYDGMVKYADPGMTGGRSVRRTVHDEREREDALRRAGATTIIRLDYQEVTQIKPLVRKLVDAGVPTLDSRWARG